MKGLQFALAVALFPYFLSAARAGDIYEDGGKQRAWIGQAEAAVRARLKDGESARFRNVTFHRATLRGHPLPMVCGEVNSKNGFGGYSGFARFISAASAESTFMEEEVADFDDLWQSLCR